MYIDSDGRSHRGAHTRAVCLDSDAQQRAGAGEVRACSQADRGRGVVSSASPLRRSIATMAEPRPNSGLSLTQLLKVACMHSTRYTQKRQGHS